jgi:hypothetical protein
MTTPAAGSPVIPSALDQAVATDAAALSAAPSELQLLIGSLENLAAGVIPGLAAAGAAAVSPALSPEAAAAAALLAAELRSLPAAQAADANATAVAGVGLVQQAIGPSYPSLRFSASSAMRHGAMMRRSGPSLACHGSRICRPSC